METRHSIGYFPQLSPRLQGSRSEYSLRRISALDSHTLESPEYEEYRALRAKTLQVTDNLEIASTPRIPSKLPHPEKKAELTSGFSLFQSLFPSGEERRLKALQEDTFHEENHVIVRPKAAGVEGGLSPRWTEAVALQNDPKPKFTARKRVGKKPDKQLDLMSWLDVESPVPLRQTLSFPLEAAKALPTLPNTARPAKAKQKTRVLPLLSSYTSSEGSKPKRHFPTL